MQTERAAILAADWFPASRRRSASPASSSGASGRCWPGLDDLLVLVSEVASNAVRHTASGNNGWFDLTVSVADMQPGLP